VRIIRTRINGWPTAGGASCATLARMTAVVLLVTGTFLGAWGSWRGYVSARAALIPLLREGDPTRTLIDATRPVHARTRVRVMARHGVLAVAWLSLAMYGLYLATIGFETIR
jgi:hypothetical protein